MPWLACFIAVQVAPCGSWVKFPIRAEFKTIKLTLASGSTQPEMDTRRKHPGKVKAVCVMLTTLPLSTGWSINV